MHHYHKRKGKITPPAVSNYWIPPLPPVETLRLVNEHLGEFFDTYQVPDFEIAEDAFFAYYESIHPTTEWYRYLDGGKTGGRTHEDGKIHLQHPEDWKRGKRHNSKRLFVRTVIHEWAHYLLYSNAEEKAERFERLFITAIRKKK